MIGGFLAQMWEVFDQFQSGLKTITVSFEEHTEMEFPSFAICDSRAFRKITPRMINAAQYNATAFDLEVSLNMYSVAGLLEDDLNTEARHKTDCYSLD